MKKIANEGLGDFVNALGDHLRGWNIDGVERSVKKSASPIVKKISKFCSQGKNNDNYWWTLNKNPQQQIVAGELANLVIECNYEEIQSPSFKFTLIYGNDNDVIYFKIKNYTKQPLIVFNTFMRGLIAHSAKSADSSKKVRGVLNTFNKLMISVPEKLDIMFKEIENIMVARKAELAKIEADRFKNAKDNAERFVVEGAPYFGLGSWTEEAFENAVKKVIQKSTIGKAIKDSYMRIKNGLLYVPGNLYYTSLTKLEPRNLKVSATDGSITVHGSYEKEYQYGEEYCFKFRCFNKGELLFDVNTGYYRNRSGEDVASGVMVRPIIKNLIEHKKKDSLNAVLKKFELVLAKLAPEFHKEISEPINKAIDTRIASLAGNSKPEADPAIANFRAESKNKKSTAEIIAESKKKLDLALK